MRQQIVYKEEQKKEIVRLRKLDEQKELDKLMRDQRELQEIEAHAALKLKQKEVFCKALKIIVGSFEE